MRWCIYNIFGHCLIMVETRVINVVSTTDSGSIFVLARMELWLGCELRYYSGLFGMIDWAENSVAHKQARKPTRTEDSTQPSPTSQCPNWGHYFLKPYIQTDYAFCSTNTGTVHGTKK